GVDRDRLALAAVRALGARGGGGRRGRGRLVGLWRRRRRTRLGRCCRRHRHPREGQGRHAAPHRARLVTNVARTRPPTVVAWSAFSRQRTPWASSSRSTCLTCRSALAGDGPSDSTRAERLLITSVAVTRITNTATIARMTRARVCIRSRANLIPA